MDTEDTEKLEDNEIVVKGQYVGVLNVIANFQMFTFVIVSVYTLVSVGINNIEDVMNYGGNVEFNPYWAILSAIIFIQGIILYIIIQAIKVTHQDVTEIKSHINDK